MKDPNRKAILVYIMIGLFVFIGCGGDENEQENSAEETLQAIYVEQTSQASETLKAQSSEQKPESKTEQSELDWALPADPPETVRTLADSVAGYSAWENRATQGDNYQNNLYERPFSSQAMIYRPDLDITEVDFASDERFYYFSIRLYGMNPEGGGLMGAYVMEFDLSLNGRGDMLVWVKDPAYEWSREGISIYGDKNRDVGGVKPMESETGFNGSGYDMVIDMDAERNAFARIDPKDGNAVQIAVSASLLEDPSEFLWGVWADDGLLDPAQFDYNDRMGLNEAGSPILGEDYPLKALFNLDNTCRLPYGTGQSGEIPGMCRVGIPTKEPSSSGGGRRCYCKENPAYDEEACFAIGNTWVCD